MENKRKTVADQMLGAFAGRSVIFTTVDKMRNPYGSVPIHGLSLKYAEQDEAELRICLSGGPEGDIQVEVPIQGTEMYVSQYGGFLFTEAEDGRLGYIFLLE